MLTIYDFPLCRYLDGCEDEDAVEFFWEYELSKTNDDLVSCQTDNEP